MKVLLFTSVLSGGGAERVLCQLANGFARKNDVILVAAYPTANEYQTDPAVEKIYIDGSPEKRHSARQIIRLRELIKKTRPDVCLSFLPQPNYKMLLATTALRVKKVVSVRNDPAVEYPGFFQRWLAFLLYRRADGIVFQTKQAKEWFPTDLQQKARVLMNQVDEKFFQLEHLQEDYYIATGRLEKQKNYPMMIRSFARFVEEYPRAVLRIYGEGTLRQEIEELIAKVKMQDHVFLMGQTSDIPGALSKAKAFLLTSDYEGMPNGLLEALAAGIACISTDCPPGGPRTVIEHMENGLLSPIGEEQAFADALCFLESDDEARWRMASLAREYAQEFHPESVLQEWENYFSKILGNDQTA